MNDAGRKMFVFQYLWSISIIFDDVINTLFMKYFMQLLWLDDLIITYIYEVL